ncbi:TIGR04255 family protein [Aquirufa salirivi]|uniref:TIGR04255 family protein n=1 Tax=Aquirufa salirivi TaxID=3104729 RepID=A0ABW8RTB0_9BACT
MNYPKAPIREAVFDIRIDKLNIIDVSELLNIKEAISNDFPIEKKRHNITGMFQFSPDKPIESKTHSDLTGFIFLSEDHSRQLQIRIDGFTLNILKPYENWETHFNLFLKYWNIYNKQFSPNNILRIATRYINKIEIPLPIDDFQEYVLNMPPIPNCLPQTFANFFMQIQVPCKSDYRNVVITETIEPILNSTLPFILDIDVFQELNVNNSVESLTKNFSEIRNIKNEIFENCITEKTRKLFI